MTEEGMDMMSLLFEQVSAFGTVGLSEYWNYGRAFYCRKSLIIVSMFLGRIGILTFAVALSTWVTTENFKYPVANIMVG